MVDLPLPVLAGLIAAAFEYPVSQRYATIPETTTAKRMLIAGGMAAAAVYLAQVLSKRQ